MLSSLSTVKALDGRSRALFIGLGVMVILNAVALLAIVIPSMNKDPLYGYRQTVTSQEVSDSKSVKLGDPVDVASVRCNSAKNNLRVDYLHSWKRVGVDDAPVVPAASGTVERPPGCISQQTEFVMPPEVVSASKALFADGEPYVLWRIEGLETPQSPDGDLDQIKSWKTESFRIYR